MEISVAIRSFPLLHSVKFWYNSFIYTYRKQSTVQLAHKTYGNLSGDSPIIIIHGLLGMKRNWDSMAQRLQDASNKAVIAVDVRNHGESPHAPSHDYQDLSGDVRQLMDSKQIKEAIFIGHSMGGRTAMALALTEPSKVAHLIVVDISPISSPSLMTDFFPRLMDVMRSINFNDAKDIPNARDMAKNVLKASSLKVDLGTINFVLMNVGKRDGKIGWNCNIDVLDKYFNNIASFPTDLKTKTYNGPTLLIAGEKSHFVPKEDVNAIRNLFPNLVVEYVADSGHNVHVEKPDVFLKLVKDFLQKPSKKI